MVAMAHSGSLWRSCWRRTEYLMKLLKSSYNIFLYFYSLHLFVILVEGSDYLR
ncbi:hypothetical protein EVA_02899 [gut metagenome]|uniref:Uncharacterized protein n=1 Tax=gut metagenome TaxID=749906 RepID=J9H542_9ZZZZ